MANTEVVEIQFHGQKAYTIKLLICDAYRYSRFAWTTKAAAEEWLKGLPESDEESALRQFWPSILSDVNAELIRMNNEANRENDEDPILHSPAPGYMMNEDMEECVDVENVILRCPICKKSDFVCSCSREQLKLRIVHLEELLAKEPS